MLMEMAGSRSCGGRAFQDNGLDEENARDTPVIHYSIMYPYMFLVHVAVLPSLFLLTM